MIDEIKSVINAVKTGLELFVSKPITYMFPPETPLTTEFRGRHVLDLEKCKSCGLCSRVCPNKALEMTERKIAKRSQEKVARYPQIDLSLIHISEPTRPY